MLEAKFPEVDDSLGMYSGKKFGQSYFNYISTIIRSEFVLILNLKYLQS